MARNVLSALNQTIRAMERAAAQQQKADERAHKEAIRRAEQARKAEERAAKMASKAALADRRRLEKEAKVAHIAAMEAKVDALNSELVGIYEEIDCLLAATLSVDDFVDLEKLRRTSDNPPFDRSDLEVPTPPPAEIPERDEPILTLPDPPKGLFGRKKKHAKAIASAEAAHSEAHAAWEREMKAIQVRRKKNARRYSLAEQKRITTLEKERARFDAEIAEHNERIDTLITNLSYGTPEAIQEYVSIVVSNSVYPEHFQVKHSFTFEPTTAELKMGVLVPPPSSFPTTKVYKYKKSSDEIANVQLSQKESKDRYSSAVCQVALRTFHEVFEADRRGIIKTIALEVGTEDTVPAIGKIEYIPFVAAAAERSTFIEFNLSAIVPVETLKYLGAAISKNPYGLAAADITGIRRS